jgi:hypothetical protein
MWNETPCDRSLIQRGLGIRSPGLGRIIHEAVEGLDGLLAIVVEECSGNNQSESGFKLPLACIIHDEAHE